jgi:hypothetical protein
MSRCRTCGQELPVMKTAIFILTVLTLSSICATTVPAEENASKGPAVLFKLEADFAHAVAEHGHAAFVSYFAEDGVELDDGGGINSRDDIAKQPAWPEGTSLSWTPVKADMAASGDLGYTYGNYIFKSKNKDGKIVAH